MQKFTRRSVVAALGAAAGLAASARRAPAANIPDPRAQTYAFFDATEARFIEAACARLIPEDAAGPGALRADVPRYLDRQLAGAWGAGNSIYRMGSWQPGTPANRGGPRFEPARLFRAALSAIRRTAFHEWPAPDQDAYLRYLADGGTTLAGVPSAVFFQMLLAMTAEGYFSHPVHGGTRDRFAWPMHGFPGAHSIAHERGDRLSSTSNRERGRSWGG
jgi:gluconate 2-dehydrogenase gamma chain